MLIDKEKAGVPVERDSVRKLSEYLNTLGGTYLIDSFSFDSLYKKAGSAFEHFVNM